MNAKIRKYLLTVTPADRWRGSISCIALLITFCATFSPARLPATDAIELSECNFWVGIVTRGNIQPFGGCFKGDWSTPEIVADAKAGGKNIPIPADWSNGAYPPPLEWRVYCQNWEDKKVVVIGVAVGQGNVYLKPKSTISGSYCFAISGNVQIQPLSVFKGESGTDFSAKLSVKDHNIWLAHETLEDGETSFLAEQRKDNSINKIFETGGMYGQN
jgi:hypothetical protein